MIILLNISDNIQPHIHDYTDADDAWKKLQQVFEYKNQN